ncbi:hypothetical protein GQ43DRAFT_479616 [Delitschia confertaspora ATCC 74209]|uniref:DNA-directed RNA polymerase III subunit RPC3 n=1 Tax=Delitschia confertaspora ATCC 74209 TaxID=1513339 RepID=A0A9P4MTP1_9PLEO|nr:hypothetical protein GQ43DRAFT_479616 [Delitschia confertaspora ATCC 74209]
MSLREAPVLAQLCTLLVEDQYGQLASRIFALLARRGRQDIHSLVRNSYFTKDKIKHGLVILIQQHLVFYYTDADNGLTSYEVDWVQAYCLVRFGKMIKMTENRFGGKAGAIISMLASLGHTRVGDLVHAYFPPGTETNGLTNGAHKSSGANGTNGNGAAVNGTTNGLNPAEATQASDDRIRSPEALHAILYALLDAGWLVPAHPTHYLSPGDRQSEAENAVIKELYEGMTPSGAKALNELKTLAIQRKRKVRDESLELPKNLIKFDRSNTSRKRAAEDDGGQASKRMRVDGDNSIITSTTEYECITPDFPEDVTLDDNLVVRVNHEKLTVALRGQQLVQLAEKRFCKTTSEVYKALLWCLEKAEPRCYEEWPDPSDPKKDGQQEESTYVDPMYLATCLDVVKILNPALDLLEGLEPAAAVTCLDTNQATADERGYIQPPVDPLLLTRSERLRLINKHLMYLANDANVQFVTWESQRGGGQYRVDYNLLARVMLQMEIDNTVMAGEGKMGLRLIRALKRKGRLSERLVCKTTLTTPNMIRSVITKMQIKGLIETQEIPKVDSRVTKQSDHLIWYDTQRVRERLLHDVYKGMIRILQRIAYEKDRIKDVLQKAERTDVVGNEDKYLSKEERLKLKHFEEVQEKLLIQLAREDDLVAVLRDFTGPIPPDFPVGYRRQVINDEE